MTPHQCICRDCGAAFIPPTPKRQQRPGGPPLGRRPRTGTAASNLVPVTCDYCGAIAYDRPSRAANRRYCSRKCWGLSRGAGVLSPSYIRAQIMGRTQIGDCWQITHGLDVKGYGKHTVGQRQLRATRIGWWLATGSWPPDDLVVGHTCDNPPCWRHDDIGTYDVGGTLYPRRGHLWLGPNAANTLDRHLKGRCAKNCTNHGVIIPSRKILR